MTPSLERVLAAVSTAQKAVAAARDLAADVALVMAPADQEVLSRRLEELARENDEGHRRLQLKLREAAK